MPYPVFPDVPPPCGNAVWPVPPAPAAPGLVLQNTVNGTLDMTRGTNGLFKGDFVACGGATRNAGFGDIKFFLPKGVASDSVVVHKAFIIINTYVADSVADPSALEPYTLLHESGGPAQLLTVPFTPPYNGGFIAWCGSTCWSNPGPSMTTYLKNRVYAWDVTAYVSVKNAGNYTVGGLPLNPLMPIGTDGDRLPGCASSQGAVLYVIYRYLETLPWYAQLPPRCIQAYLGARLMAVGGPWGGVASQLLQFNQTPSGPTFSGNAKVTLAAGDTQNSVAGDGANVNNTTFSPTNNAFRKLGSSLSVITQNMSNVYAGINQLTVETLSDCISWFFFAVSADNTLPKADFKPNVCVSTRLEAAIDAATTTIIVLGNNSVNPATSDCGNVANKTFPTAPFYVRIENEILLVTSKVDQGGVVLPNQEPRRWTVQRGAGGTTPATHAADKCVKQVMPIEGKSRIQAALAKKGLASFRPGAGQLKRNRINGF